jgi:hypothetical protein
MNDVIVPLLSNYDKPHFPIDNRCPICLSQLTAGNGIAYLYGGALVNNDRSGETELEDNLKVEVDSRAFLDIGFHGKNVSVRDSVNINIVDNLRSDQFSITFCSLTCMRTWFNRMIDVLELRLLTARQAMVDDIET